MSDRILVIEDEPVLAQGILDALKFAGYGGESSADGPEGLRKIRSGGFDLVVLDLMLPELSGFEILEAVRADGNRVPIIILTALGGEEDRVRGLELGADDYVSKPFSIRELIARVGAQLRRSRYGDADTSLPILKHGAIRVDLDRLEVEREGQIRPLTAREGAILKYLWTHRERVVTRDELLRKVWEYNTADLETRTVDATMAFLRKKIEVDTSNPGFVITARGQGYKLGDVQVV